MTETALLSTTDNTPGAPNSALKEPPPAVGDGYQVNHAAAAHLQIVDAEEAIIDAGATPRRKIAVCGFASSSRHLIPIGDPTWEIWGMNQLYRHIPRADRWFDIHWNWDKEVVPGTDYRGWLSTCQIPVYMIATLPDIPTSVKYPIHKMMALAGDYFTSTVAFMVALATWEIDQRVMRRLEDEFGPKMDDTGITSLGLAEFTQVLKRQRELYPEYMIGLFGIDLVVEEEYFWQKPCAEFWIGLAVGRGIEVFIPPQSALCKQGYRYGYEPEPQTVIRPSEIDQHHKMLMEERKKHLDMVLMHDGAMQTDEYWKRLVELRSRGAEVRL